MPVETGNAFIDKLLEQAPEAVSQPKRGQNYNYAERLYLKPDGTVVKLQGDPTNRAYYQDKGFRLLSENPGRNGGKSEVRQYLEDEYPRLLAEQAEKAKIINTIRKAGERYKDLALEDTFDDYSIEDLRDYLKDVKDQTGKDIRVVTPRRQRERESSQERQMLQGVETTETASIEGLQQHLSRRRRGEPEL